MGCPAEVLRGVLQAILADEKVRQKNLDIRTTRVQAQALAGETLGQVFAAELALKASLHETGLSIGADFSPKGLGN